MFCLSPFHRFNFKNLICFHTLVYSAEVDALDAKSETEGGHYVEFKTSKELQYPTQHENFKR